MAQPKTLSQEEIDALLTAMPADTGAAQTAAPVAIAARPPMKVQNVKGYDFRRPDKFSKEHIRTLTVMHQTLARLISTSLSSRLRTMTTVRLTSIDQVLYEEYIGLVPSPAVIHIMAMEPLAGNVLLEYGAATGLLLVDRLLGGNGRSYEEPHEVTDLEIALINKFAQSFEGLIAEAWLNIMETTPRLQGTELSAQFVQIAAPGDVVITVLYELQIGEYLGAMSLCLPYSTLETALPKLTTQGWFVNSSRGAIAELDRERLQRQLKRVEVDVSVKLGETEISAADLVSLRPGDVLRLDNLATREIDFRVGTRTKFRGSPGLAGKRMGLKITTVCDQVEE